MGLSVACPQTRQHKMPQVILVPEREVQVPKVELPEGDLHRIPWWSEQTHSASFHATAFRKQSKTVHCASSGVLRGVRQARLPARMCTQGGRSHQTSQGPAPELECVQRS